MRCSVKNYFINFHPRRVQLRIILVLFLFGPSAEAWMPGGALTQKRLNLLAGSPNFDPDEALRDGPTLKAHIPGPTGITIDSSGNVLVLDSNSLIRKISVNGVVSTFAGQNSGGFNIQDGYTTAAKFYGPTGIKIDSTGNIFVADQNAHVIRKITPAGYVSTFAGLAGSSGSTNGTGSAARFNYPSEIAIDSADNLFVADALTHTIRKITPAAVVTTFVGTAGSSGTSDGTGAAARFNRPWGIAIDSSNNLYVADSLNNTIRKITPAAVVTTIAGLAGTAGNTDGTGSAARFRNPHGLAVNSSGDIFVADSSNASIRKVTSSGVVTTLAGGAYAGYQDGTGSGALFTFPRRIVVESSGSILVSDTQNNAIRRVTMGGVVTTFAGALGTQPYLEGLGEDARITGVTGLTFDSSGNMFVSATTSIRKVDTSLQTSLFVGKQGIVGTSDGTGTNAQFNWSFNIVFDSLGNLFVADRNNHTIRKVTPGGVVTTFAGLAGTSGSVNGTGSAARFNQPFGITRDSSDNLYVADMYTYTIRRITPAGVVTTFAGTMGSSGHVDATGAAARFTNPNGIVRDSLGNFFVTDSISHTIRKITPGAVVTTFAGSNGISGTTDGTGTSARFYSPYGIAIDASDNLYVCDGNNDTIRKITPAGVVTTLAGYPGVSGNQNGIGSEARFNFPWAIAVGPDGNIYVAENTSTSIRKISPAGLVSTVVGFLPKFKGSTDAVGTNARFNLPVGVAIDSAGYVYVADASNQTIRRVSAEGNVLTIAGAVGLSGAVNGTGSAARFNVPWGVISDSSGNLYVTETSNHAIRKITSGGVVTTYAGTLGLSGSSNVGLGTFNSPSGAVFDSGGNLFVVDTGNHTIRKVTSGGVVSTFAGTAGASGSTDATGAAARFKSPGAIAIDASNNLFVADSGNFTIRKITPAGVVTTLAGTAGVGGFLDGAGGVARFSWLTGIALDPVGNIYVADMYNNAIRKITSGGSVTTIIGNQLANIDVVSLPAQIIRPRGVAVANGKLYMTTANAVLYAPIP